MVAGLTVIVCCVGFVKIDLYVVMNTDEMKSDLVKTDNQNTDSPQVYI